MPLVGASALYRCSQDQAGTGWTQKAQVHTHTSRAPRSPTPCDWPRKQNDSNRAESNLLLSVLKERFARIIKKEKQVPDYDFKVFSFLLPLLKIECRTRQKKKKKNVSQGSLGQILSVGRTCENIFRAFQVSLKHSLIFSFVLRNMFRQVNVLNPLNSPAGLPLMLEKRKTRGLLRHTWWFKTVEQKTRALVVRLAGN